MEQSNIDLKEYGCFFADYNKEMRPIFYIKLSILMNLFDLQKQKKHRIFEQMLEEENGDEIYILKIEDMGLPFLPVQKDIIYQMMSEGVKIEDLDVDKFVEENHDIYPYITKDYMEKSLSFLNHELKKTQIQLQKYKIMQQIENEEYESSNGSTSDTMTDGSDSDSAK